MLNNTGPDDIRVEPLDQRKVCQRRKRYREHLPQQLGQIPGEWRELLIRWVRRGGNSRWETLRNDAGVTGIQMAQSLLDWLLREGWAIVVEQRQHGGWWPVTVELREVSALRAKLGLPDDEAIAQRWIEKRIQLESLADEALMPLIQALDKMPATRALPRATLVEKLAAWKQDQRTGTRRDFANFARGHTKAISDAEWTWLENNTDLADWNIERHTPILLVAAPISLTLPDGVIDLATMPDFAALTPATIKAALSADSRVTLWRLVENRTSFERVAKLRDANIGVIWLPGFPPTWWQEVVAKLLTLAPAPAEIACDPDPSGIAIALSAAKLWEQQDLPWTPWKMDVALFATLSDYQPLTERDIKQLDEQLTNPLPSILKELAQEMLRTGKKGEQEGYL